LYQQSRTAILVVVAVTQVVALLVLLRLGV
jgi:hypothetical protein